MAYEIPGISGAAWFRRELVETLTLSDVQYIPFVLDATTWSNQGNSVTSVGVTVTTSEASLLVALCAAEPEGNYTGGVASVAGGTDLTTAWASAAGGGNGNFVAGANAWIAVTGSGQSSQTITATWANSQQNVVLTVLSFTGFKTSGPVGATLAVGTTASNLSRTITATANGSYILAVAMNAVANGGPTAGADSTVIYGPNALRFSVRSTNTVSAGDFTISTTGSSAGTATSTALEILAA